MSKTIHYEFWCLTCPTRIVVEHDGGKVDLWAGTAYTTCNVCGGPLGEPDELMKKGITRYDGSTFKIRAKTPGEHARLNAIWPEDDKSRDREAWERQGREKGFM